MTRQGRAPLRPAVPRKWTRIDDRSIPVRTGSPEATAMLRTRQLGLFDRGADVYDEFLSVFHEVRQLELGGYDTEGVWLAMQHLPGPDRDLATAAYIEAVASTRKAGWAE